MHALAHLDSGRDRDTHADRNPDADADAYQHRDHDGHFGLDPSRVGNAYCVAHDHPHTDPDTGTSLPNVRYRRMLRQCGRNQLQISHGRLRQ
jgi:hypothetical protein